MYIYIYIYIYCSEYAEVEDTADHDPTGRFQRLRDHVVKVDALDLWAA